MPYLMATIIHAAEFLASFARCVQPGVIAVANSGGPDSTCLLFLLSRLRPPVSLVSLHVDHGLQPASADMANRATANAASMGIPHHTLQIPWGRPPFPHRPVPGTPFENIARQARYHVLFHGMTHSSASILALGHHADDQVETSLMRLARGSTLVGAAGMRRHRRWGMGSGNSTDDLAWVGHPGMSRFIIRPLLDFSKDRILATCDAHALSYVNDPTNLHPETTLRNALRQMLASPTLEATGSPPLRQESLEQVRKASSFLQSITSDVTDTRERLRRATVLLAERTEQLDSQVTEQLQNCILPSPPSTLLLSTSGLLTIDDPAVRFALVLRAMRYISFHPWGSTRADGDRRRAGIQRIMNHLWPVEPPVVSPKKFTTGAGVLWDSSIKARCHFGKSGSAQSAWLASRLPPFFKNPQEGTGSASRLSVDVTKQLMLANATSRDVVPVLYDCRFLVGFDLAQMPEHVRNALNNAHDQPISIKILPQTDYFWPKVVLQQDSGPDLVLAVLNEKGEVVTFGSRAWISMEWVRLLDAT
ncbi:hypothetical protein EDC04DRAFT_2865124 [Pisolithus marmoratus]|nr:hypothetical protein EDC04DRAFT_2865124 [Pisolithus marmoratus]